MGLTEQKKNEWENSLKDAGLLSLTDKLFLAAVLAARQLLVRLTIKLPSSSFAM